MARAIVVHPEFDGYWPFAADRLRELWAAEDDLSFVRLERPDLETPLRDLLADPASVECLVSYGVPVAEGDVAAMDSLREAAVTDTGGFPEEDSMARLEDAGVTTHDPRVTEGYWKESVAEFALGLTISALRRIPQLHAQITEDTAPWDYSAPSDPPMPGERGIQYDAVSPHASGTVARKNVRLVGVGNIGSMYATYTSTMGADVAAWDPYADEPCFHRSGARRVHDLEDLLDDAEIFAPMVPLTDGTRGLVTREHVEALPEGCLVVLATRHRVVDGDALRERVLADELALAADVWDGNPGEPIPLGDEVLGRDNVVHTPHAAGRTEHANHRFAEMLADQFEA